MGIISDDNDWNWPKFGQAIGYVADLSLLSEVRALGERIAKEHPRLDGVLHNAFGGFTEHQQDVARQFMDEDDKVEHHRIADRDLDLEHNLGKEMTRGLGRDLDKAADRAAHFPALFAADRAVPDQNARASARLPNATRAESAEGHEVTLALNVLAPFLLSSLLLPSLHASGNGRIVLAAGATTLDMSEQLDDLECKVGWSEERAWALAKLCDAMIALEMHARYGAPPRLCVNTIDPGTFDARYLFFAHRTHFSHMSHPTFPISHLLFVRCETPRRFVRAASGPGQLEAGDVD